MFNLKVELKSEKHKNIFSNFIEIQGFLELTCKSFITKVNDYYKLNLEEDSCFNVNCKVSNDTIKCCITCKSYDTVLKIIQGFFRIEILEFKSYKFITMSLEIEELSIDHSTNQVVNFVPA